METNTQLCPDSSEPLDDKGGGTSFGGGAIRVENAETPTSSAAEVSAISVVPWTELTDREKSHWSVLRQRNPSFTPPFFSPRFCEAIQAARGDVQVAVFRSDDKESLPLGFFPFHVVGRVGVPVGRFLNDAQNVVGVPIGQIDWTSLIKAAGVVGFDLHAIVDCDPKWIEDYQLGSVRAFRADFNGDSQGFLTRLEKEHRTIGKQGQKTRKLGREVGPLRVEIDCRCKDVLEQAIAWKRAQYQRTHILDLFHPDWTRKLVDVLHGESEEPDLSFQDEPLRGLLSVLWAGDHPVAAHFGMIEEGRLHYWFPTYDPHYARYSPGTALFTELVRQSSDSGIDCIDMGYGEQPYKQKQTATTSNVAFGTVTDSRWHRFAFASEAKLVGLLKQMPMKEPVKRVWRAVNPTAGIKKLK